MLSQFPLLVHIGCPPAEPAGRILASTTRLSFSPIVIGMENNQIDRLRCWVHCKLRERHSSRVSARGCTIAACQEQTRQQQGDPQGLAL